MAKRLWHLLLVFWLSFPILSAAQATGKTRIILDPETFHYENFAHLQTLADRVAALVDDLIPGLSKDYPVGGIVCFEASATWGSDPAHPAPITLQGPKLPGEPVATTGGTVRIALFGTQGVYERRFVMQLAHELAHVKMGTRIDNVLVETLASAVAYEVLRRASAFDYLIPMQQRDILALPKDTQNRLAEGDIPGLKAYWQQQATVGWSRLDDRPLQTLGALLMQMGDQPKWGRLLNISEAAACPVGLKMAASLKLCPPDADKLRNAGLVLTSLGY